MQNKSVNPRGATKTFGVFVFVYVSFVILILICLIRHCSGYRFGNWLIFILVKSWKKVPTNPKKCFRLTSNKKKVTAFCPRTCVKFPCPFPKKNKKRSRGHTVNFSIFAQTLTPNSLISVYHQKKILFKTRIL